MSEIPVVLPIPEASDTTPIPEAPASEILPVSRVESNVARWATTWSEARQGEGLPLAQARKIAERIVAHAGKQQEGPWMATMRRGDLPDGMQARDLQGFPGLNLTSLQTLVREVGAGVWQIQDKANGHYYPGMKEATQGEPGKGLAQELLALGMVALDARDKYRKLQQDGWNESSDLGMLKIASAEGALSSRESLERSLASHDHGIGLRGHVSPELVEASAVNMAVQAWAGEQWKETLRKYVEENLENWHSLRLDSDDIPASQRRAVDFFARDSGFKNTAASDASLEQFVRQFESEAREPLEGAAGMFDEINGLVQQREEALGRAAGKWQESLGSEAGAANQAYQAAREAISKEGSNKFVGLNSYLRRIENGSGSLFTGVKRGSIGFEIDTSAHEFQQAATALGVDTEVLKGVLEKARDYIQEALPGHDLSMATDRGLWNMYGWTTLALAREQMWLGSADASLGERLAVVHEIASFSDRIESISFDGVAPERAEALRAIPYKLMQSVLGDQAGSIQEAIEQEKVQGSSAANLNEFLNAYAAASPAEGVDGASSVEVGDDGADLETALEAALIASETEAQAAQQAMAEAQRQLDEAQARARAIEDIQETLRQRQEQQQQSEIALAGVVAEIVGSEIEISPQRLDQVLETLTLEGEITPEQLQEAVDLLGSSGIGEQLYEAQAELVKEKLENMIKAARAMQGLNMSFDVGTAMEKLKEEISSQLLDAIQERVAEFRRRLKTQPIDVSDLQARFAELVSAS